MAPQGNPSPTSPSPSWEPGDDLMSGAVVQEEERDQLEHSGRCSSVIS